MADAPDARNPDPFTEAMQAGDPARALALADAHLAQEPDSVTWLVRRGLACTELEQMDDALAAFDRALTLDPASVSALYRRGIARYQIEDVDGAVADLSAAIRLDGRLALAYLQRGYAFYSRGSLPAAFSDFSQYAKLAPTDPIGHNNRAFVALQMGRTTQAEESWSRCTRLPDAPHWAFAGHAVALHRMKKRRPAAAQLREAIAREPGWRDALDRTAEDYHWTPDMIETAAQILAALAREEAPPPTEE